MRRIFKEPGITPEEIHDRIVGGHIHNTLVFLQYFVPLPSSLITLFLILLGLGGIIVWLPFWIPVFIVYVIFVMSDWFLLKKLPEKRISFAPVIPPLMIFATARVIVILTCGILPFDWSVRILAMGIIQMFMTICEVWGMVFEPFQIKVTHIEISSEKLQSSVKPVKILHISDIHIERITKREEDIVRLTNELNPDLIVLTGDFINFSYVKDTLAMKDVQRFLNQLYAPCGMYAVRGTFFVDLPSVIPKLLEDTHVVLLEKEYRKISCNGHTFYIAGLPCNKHPDSDRPELKELLAQIPCDHFVLLLYHSPDLFPDAAGKVDLYLGGHTHGGQVCIPGIGPLTTSSMYGRKYYAGKYTENGTIAYISRGLGMEGLGAPRIRFFCPPELVMISLGG
ncbi:MAG: hypothetical protein A2161_03635 [Candidatus Schekmanbacteria bacterium RBG_13_48_7]|uniref:Calcineurin-like phosphoesterase domain-containing protein n=1 Tax=Candidatus Schekmanbacteria bacterium RBG_13_48_7 TaxID=1817878 RepID=A0A1F7RP54_9BACT|nr:MAG: hypothetical protein A2161_03635 [Candidatus Schekmanbacteria bacterium RBG_13_48_7]